MKMKNKEPTKSPPFGMTPKWIYDSKLSEKLGAIAMAVYTYRAAYSVRRLDNKCFYSQRKIARQLKICEKTVMRADAKLAEEGLIKKVGKSLPGIRGTVFEVIFDQTRSRIIGDTVKMNKARQKKRK